MDVLVKQEPIESLNKSTIESILLEISKNIQNLENEIREITAQIIKIFKNSDFWTKKECSTAFDKLLRTKIIDETSKKIQFYIAECSKKKADILELLLLSGKYVQQWKELNNSQMQSHLCYSKQTLLELKPKACKICLDLSKIPKEIIRVFHIFYKYSSFYSFFFYSEINWF